MNRGFIIIAQNTEELDYIKCAEVLVKSIKKVMPNESVTLITNENYDNSLFDNVVPFPHGDLDPTGKWKLINDWQVYGASPYEFTIKLEADLYIPQSIDYWWDILQHRDLVISSCVRNYRQEISNVRVYRRFLDDNKLPNVYNSITYFKKSELAEEFFKIVKNVFDRWPEYKKFLKCKIDEEVSTDWAYSIASHILGIEKTTMPAFNAMSMIHMKQFINELPTEDWTDKLVYEVTSTSLRINTIPQLYPFHYYKKSFCNKLETVL